MGLTPNFLDDDSSIPGSRCTVSLTDVAVPLDGIMHLYCHRIIDLAPA